jgi:hypothetical protein
VIASLFVSLLVEFAYQLLEQIAHLKIRDARWRQINLGRAKLLDDQIETIVLVQLLDLALKIELIENIAGAWREPLDVVAQIDRDIRRIAEEFLERIDTSVDEQADRVATELWDRTNGNWHRMQLLYTALQIHAVATEEQTLMLTWEAYKKVLQELDGGR